MLSFGICSVIAQSSAFISFSEFSSRNVANCSKCRSKLKKTFETIVIWVWHVRKCQNSENSHKK